MSTPWTKQTVRVPMQCVGGSGTSAIKKILRQFNADVSMLLAQYESRALSLRRGTRERVTATREAIAKSQALIAHIIELDANFAAHALRMGWLWPAY
jgi:hypothetical protein